MTDQYPLSRRTVMRGTGIALLGAVTASGISAASEDAWTVAETPTNATLRDVVYTNAGAYAVGDGGRILERTSDGWETVLAGGPNGNGDNFRGADVTADGERLWAVGASGLVVEYDVTTGDLANYSAPNDVTNTFNDVAATADGGEANVYVADDSGKVYYSFDNGTTWDEVTPASGANINAIDFYDDTEGVLVDGNKAAFATQDGETWEQVGIPDAGNNLYGLDADAEDDISVAGGNGSVYEYDGVEWVREVAGETALQAIDADGVTALTVGGSGAVFRRDSDGWTREETPVEENLLGAVRGSPDIAVGDAGTVIEHDGDGSTGGGGDGGDGGDGSEEDDTQEAETLTRTSTQTSESPSLTFAVENQGEESVTVEAFALETDVDVETIDRADAEVVVDGDTTGTADAADGFPVDGELRPLDTAAVFDPGTAGLADFGDYDGGNVELTVEPATEKPASDFVAATLAYGDDTQQTFYFEVTNVNS